MALIGLTLLATRRATVAKSRYIGPRCLCDRDFKVRRPIIESLAFLGLILVAVVSADQFPRNVIKNRDDQKYSRKLTATIPNKSLPSS